MSFSTRMVMTYWIDLTYKDGKTRSLHGIGTAMDIIEVVWFLKRNWEIKRIKVRKEV